jgi:hypothetical protein
MTAAKYKAITIQEKKVRDRIDLLDNQKNRSDERKTRRSITIQEYRIDRLNSTTKRTGQVEEPQRAVKGERPKTRKWKTKTTKRTGQETRRKRRRPSTSSSSSDEIVNR